LAQVGVLLALALLLGRLAVRLGMPAVVGELFAGVVAGPSLFGHAWPAAFRTLMPTEAASMHLLDAVGQLGVLLLVGITALEMDLGLLGRRATTVARVSLAGLLLPLALGVTLGLLLPAQLRPEGVDPRLFAAFLGVVMCVSAI